MFPDIKNYELIEEIGRGGMATVYKAWQPSLSRTVALKVLPPYFAHDEELLLRFRHEARAVAKLRHPHIVQVFDFHQEDDWFYLAMEFIGGGSLQDRLGREGRLSRKAAIGIAAQVAEGLHHAHTKGFIHRDIKPSNILLSEDGEAVITDFGIVKAVEGTRVTKSVYGGMGTSEYMSPEQSRGDAVSRSSDLYSLGVVLYESLTGGPPFAGESPMAVMHSQIYDEPAPPSQTNQNVTPELEDIVLRLLAKDAGSRFQSGLELVAALNSVEAGTGVVRESVPEAPDGTAVENLVGRVTLVRRETRIAKVEKPVPRASVEDVSTPQLPETDLRPEREMIGKQPGRLLAALIAGVAVLAFGISGYLIGSRYLWNTAGNRAAAAPVKSRARASIAKKAPKLLIMKAAPRLSTASTATVSTTSLSVSTPTPPVPPPPSPTPVRVQPRKSYPVAPRPPVDSAPAEIPIAIQ